MQALRPILSKNGLSFSQQIVQDEEGPSFLISIIIHTSGQYIESKVRISPQKNDQQSYGSALTYLRRYAGIALLGVTTAADPSDDDAQTIPHVIHEERIGHDMAAILEQELQGFPDLKKTILEKTGINSLAYLPKNKYQSTIDWIRKNTRQQ